MTINGQTIACNAPGCGATLTAPDDRTALGHAIANGWTLPLGRTGHRCPAHSAR